MSDKEIEVEPGGGCIFMFVIFMVVMTVLWGATMYELQFVLQLLFSKI